MPVVATPIYGQRYEYSYTAVKKKCLNCGTEIISGDNIYSKRFCTEKCKLKYLI